MVLVRVKSTAAFVQRRRRRGFQTDSDRKTIKDLSRNALFKEKGVQTTMNCASETSEIATAQYKSVGSQFVII